MDQYTARVKAMQPFTYLEDYLAKQLKLIQGDK